MSQPLDQSKNKIYVFGNGKIEFDKFIDCYASVLAELCADQNNQFIVCDFRGADTLTLEFLKSQTGSVSLYHMGSKPRYMVDRFRTKSSQWRMVGGFLDDAERDGQAMKDCDSFLAFDFNSNQSRTSSTSKNIDMCLEMGKTRIFC